MSSLRESLFEAAAAGELTRVEELCREHADAIAAESASWQTVPTEVRSDAEAMQRYAHGLITVARVLAERLGEPSLMQRLVGPRDGNPLVQWEARLRAIRADMTELRYAEAITALEALLEETGGLQGSGPAQLRPVTQGLLAECLFQTRQAERAIPIMETALAASQARQDGQGVVAYLGNLFEAHRYLGHRAEAASFADRLADVFQAAGADSDAKRYRRVAQIVRAGEPKNRVVALLDDDSRLELDEVTAETGRIRFVFERDRLTLRAAALLVERGRTAGSNGNLSEALALFQRAAAADPHDPDARYQEGFTLLLERRYDEAVSAYEAAEALAPGWYHCRADLWLARELAAGRLSHALFMALYELADGPGDAAAKLALADRALADAPDLAPLHFHRGRALVALDRPDEARAAFRAGLASAPEPDIETRLCVALAFTLEPGDERRALLARAIERDGNLIAAATAKIVSR